MISLQCALAVFLDSAKNVILEPGSWSFPQISPKSATLHRNTIEIPRFLTCNKYIFTWKIKKRTSKFSQSICFDEKKISQVWFNDSPILSNH